MEENPEEKEQVWATLAQSLRNGLSLELKLFIVKNLLPLGSARFPMSLCSQQCAVSLPITEPNQDVLIIR